MPTNSRDSQYPFSDGFERRLIQQLPRNRQRLNPRNCALPRAKMLTMKSFAQNLLMLMNLLKSKLPVSGSAGRSACHDDS